MHLTNIRTLARTALVILLLSLHAPLLAETHAIVGARVYPHPDARPLDRAVILVRNGMIEKVGRADVTPVPAGYAVVDWTGMVIVAGYWNSHVHLTTPVFLRAPQASDNELEAELERTFTRWGFTTIFDLASTTAIASEVRSRVEQGAVRGPRVLSVAEPFYPKRATPVYARPFYEAFNLPSGEVASADQAASRAQQQIANGAAGLKLFTGSIVSEDEVVPMPAAIIEAVAAVGRSHEVPVFAHPTDRRGLELAVDHGVTVLAHSAPLMGPWPAHYARRISRKKVALVPTLALFANASHRLTPIETAIQQTRAFHRAGGVVLFGTDAGFTEGFDTNVELRLMHQAIGGRAVLASLTTAPASVFGEKSLRGRVVPGQTADLVALSCDFAMKVDCFADVQHVMKQGKIIFSRKQ